MRVALGGRVKGKLRHQRHKEKEKEAAVREQSVRRGVGGGKRGFDGRNEGHFLAQSWQVHPPLKFFFKLQVQQDTEKHRGPFTSGNFTLHIPKMIVRLPVSI